MRAKSLFWFLVVLALAAGFCYWAWPKLQSQADRPNGYGPKTVVIHMPTPGG